MATVAGGVRDRDLSAADRDHPIRPLFHLLEVGCRGGSIQGGSIHGGHSSARDDRRARAAGIPWRPEHGTDARVYSDCAVEWPGDRGRGCWRPGVHWDVAREPSGCSASWLSCCSWPHQVGEGNRGCATPWGHRYSCDSWDFASLVHQKRGSPRRRHAVAQRSRFAGFPPVPASVVGRKLEFSADN